jgi:hypothetical protein
MPFNRVWSPTNSNDPAFQPIAKPKSGMFGGNSRRIAGIIGDALGGLAGQPPLYAQQQYAQRHDSEMLQRQMALAQWKMQNPDPTPMQRNYEYLKGMRPDLAEQYLRAEANPQTLMTDPATGAVTFQPKGGLAPQAPITKKLPNGQDAYWVNGAWYDNPEGKE